MKKLVFSIAVLLFGFFFSYAQSFTLQPKYELSALDSSMYFKGDTVNVWDAYYKRKVFEKNQLGLPVVYIDSLVLSNSWIKADSTIYHYYDNGHLEYYVSFFHNDTTYCEKYDTYDRMTFKVYRPYDYSMGEFSYGNKTYRYYSGENDAPDSVILYSWNTSFSYWYLSSKYTYTYNGNGDIKEYNEYDWDNGWVNSEREIYRYNSDGLLDSVIEITYDIVNDIWKNSFLTYYSYYTGTNLVYSKIEATWDKDNNQWKNFKMYNYVYYDNGLLKRKLTYVIDQTSGLWQGKSKEFYEYDAQGRIVAEYDTTMNSGQWKPQNKKLYSYDQFGNLITSINYTWNQNYNYWENYRKLENYYSRSIFSNIPEQTFDIHIYPNPVQNLLIISGITTQAKIFIFSIDGRIFYHSNKFLNTNTIDVSSLPPGNYVLRILTDKNKVFVHKFVKL